MDRRGFVRFAAAAGTMAAPARVLFAPAGDRRLVERWSWVMGQSIHLMLYASSEDHGLEAASLALAELRRIEARLSRFDGASDLSELNRSAGRRPVRIGADLAAVLAAGARAFATTGGAFNLAVEPLMRTWGFRDPRIRPPSGRELAEARAAVLAAEVRTSGPHAFLPSASTELDLGGIGVGYGLDRAGEVLRRAGIGRALIDISGDCLAIGTPPGRAGWTIGIAKPGTRGVIERTVSLAGQALATSSNFESTIRLGAIVAGHVMDPHTGWPASMRRQATVITGRAVDADAFSTAALITGTAVGGRLLTATA